MAFMQHILIIVFSLMLLFLAIGVLLAKDLIASIIISAVFSLFAVALYVILMAVDVAITEAAVSAAMSAVIYLLAFTLVGKGAIDTIGCGVRPYVRKYRTLSWAIIGLILIAIVSKVMMLLPWSNTEAVGGIYQVSKLYIASAGNDFGIANIVTAILAGYRAFDTLLETMVIFIAAFGVAELLHPERYAQS